jgi:hypothetical protein
MGKCFGSIYNSPCDNKYYSTVNADPVFSRDPVMVINPFRNATPRFYDGGDRGVMRLVRLPSRDKIPL